MSFNSRLSGSNNVRRSMKGRTAIRLLRRFPDLRKRRYWGNHFWTKGYCVDTVGLDEDKIRQYVKYQEDKERREEQMKFGF
ncbi:MAG: transposase [Phycisphaerae bacterium]|nr:transposase [Phycisphaerae bacterium]